MGSVGEGEGGKIWENGIETCKISCMKRVASPGSMHDTGCLGLVHWDDPEGWYGEGGGRRVQDGEKSVLSDLGTSGPKTMLCLIYLCSPTWHVEGAL